LPVTAKISQQRKVWDVNLYSLAFRTVSL